MAVFTDSRFAPVRMVLGDLVESLALLSFVAGIGCGALAYAGG